MLLVVLVTAIWFLSQLAGGEPEKAEGQPGLDCRVLRSSLFVYSVQQQASSGGALTAMGP